jgi:hypothetical protein
MMFVVPLYLRDRIYDLVDEMISTDPDAAKDREILYGQLLVFFNEHGYLPPREAMTLQKPSVVALSAPEGEGGT